MTGQQETHSKRPGGREIVAWISIVFSGLLAFIGSTIATSDGMRVFLIICGIVIVATFVVSLARWYFKHGKPADQSASR